MKSKLERNLEKEFLSYFNKDNWSMFLKNKFFQREFLNITTFDEQRKKTYHMLKFYFEHFYKVFPFYEAKVKFIPIHIIIVYSIHKDSYNLLGNNYFTRVTFNNILDDYSKYEEKIFEHFDTYIKINFKNRSELLQSFLFTIQFFIKDRTDIYRIFYPLLNRYFYGLALPIIDFSYFQSLSPNYKPYDKLFNTYVLGYPNSLFYRNVNYYNEQYNLIFEIELPFKVKGLKNINFIKIIPEIILKEIFIKIFKNNIIYKKDYGKFEKEQLIYSFIGALDNEEIQKDYFKQMIDRGLFSISRIKELQEQECISSKDSEILFSKIVMAEFM